MKFNALSRIKTLNEIFRHGTLYPNVRRVDDRMQRQRRIHTIGYGYSVPASIYHFTHNNAFRASYNFKFNECSGLSAKGREGDDWRRRDIPIPALFEDV